MNVILVNSNSHEFQAGMPLGPMIIATLLNRDHGIKTTIVDLPIESKDNPNIQSFVDSLQVGDDTLFVGFSTMCNTFTRSLMVASAIKDRYPNVVIEFGGPQASATATRLLEVYPFIDVVMVGEVEGVLDSFVKLLILKERKDIPGVLFRQPNNGSQKKCEAVSYPAMAPIVDINKIPPVDYSTYPQASSDHSVSIELGRGCPYGCAFCSTKDFFQRKYRIKDAQSVIDDILRIKQERNPAIFDFSHDMLTVNRKVVSEICDKLIKLKVNIKWGCSARTDRTDAELLQLMAQAGCTNIFFGIETGSQRLQKSIGKALIIDDAKKTVLLARNLGIHVTVSTILGFPQEEVQDLTDTVNLIIQIRSWRPSIGTVQVHMLSPLAGTALYSSYFSEFLHDGFISDISSINYFTEWEIAEIKKHQDLFSSFYYIPNRFVSRSTYRFLHWILLYGQIYDDFFRALWITFNNELGLKLINWAAMQDEIFFSMFDYKQRIESIIQVADALKLFVCHLIPSYDFSERLHDLIRFELWKYKVLHAGDSTLFVSQYDYFICLDNSELNAYLAKSTYFYTYMIDPRTRLLKRIEAPVAITNILAKS